MTKEEVIDFIKNCQQTHIDWIKWYEENPEYEKDYEELVGNKNDHIRCVQGYDEVLKYLGEA